MWNYVGGVDLGFFDACAQVFDVSLVFHEISPFVMDTTVGTVHPDDRTLHILSLPVGHGPNRLLPMVPHVGSQNEEVVDTTLFASLSSVYPSRGYSDVQLCSPARAFQVLRLIFFLFCALSWSLIILR